ncbi:MAG: hypothetical protein ACH37Z_15125 [Anaerolineae bacterium]
MTTKTWPPTNSGAAMAVLVEGLASKAKMTIFGHIPLAMYRISWEAGTDIQEGDRVVYSGESYTVREVLDDTTRPTGGYQTAVLSRKLD